MKYATLRTVEGTCAAVLRGDDFHRLPYVDVGEMLRECDDLDLVSDSKGQIVADVRTANFAPLILRPSKIFCVGLNYASHIHELGREIPKHPTLFAKFANSLIGARDDLHLPACSTAFDWEAELVVVMGLRASRLDVGQARQTIAGYTIGNDISARDLQLRTEQWLAGKTVDGTAPLGPTLTTRADVDPARGLRLRCLVNEIPMQDSTTADLVFHPAQLVADISQFCTLEPADLIFTGTPGGIGALRKPPVFLKPGDVVETSIDGLGTCRNLCI